MQRLPSYTGRTLLDQIIVTLTEEMTGRRWYQWRYVQAIKEYEDILLHDADSAPAFFDFALDRLNISYETYFSSNKQIPDNGPLLIVSNHPTGFSEGMILCSLLNKYRHDLKFLANGFLTEFKYMQPYLLSLPDPNLPKAEDRKLQMESLRKAFSYLKEGNCLGVFPATRLWDYQDDDTFADPPWRPEIAKFAQIRNKDGQGVQILPVYVDIKNSPLFRFASKLGWYTMRRGLLIHEMVMQQNKKVDVYVGDIITQDNLKDFKDKQQVMDFLRSKSDALKPE